MPGGGSGGLMLDANAIHANVAGEMAAVADKPLPVATDLLMIEDSAAGNAKKSVLVGNLPASAGLGYEITIHANNWNPSDSTTRYWGSHGQTPQATEGLAPVYIMKPGTIKAAEILAWASTAWGTNEDWSMYLRLNGASDTLIATVSLAAAVRRFANAALSIPVTAGDYFEIKVVCPTWVTNPTGVYLGGRFYVE